MGQAFVSSATGTGVLPRCLCEAASAVLCFWCPPLRSAPVHTRVPAWCDPAQVPSELSPNLVAVEASPSCRCAERSMLGKCHPNAACCFSMDAVSKEG